MIAPQGMQTARFYVDTDVDTRPEIIKRLTKPRNYNSAMDKQLSIEDKVKFTKTHKYDFTDLNHGELVQALQKIRSKYYLTSEEFSSLAGYRKGHFSSLYCCKHKFNYRSFIKYRDAMINLNKKHKAEIKEVSVLAQPTQPTPSNNVELTAEMCINFLKATGNYKISKCEITTNWIEL
jgi:hypothetical protein